MRIFQILIFSFVFGFTVPTMAGPGHDHGHSHGPISKSQAISKADSKLKQLVTAGKIEKSWEGITAKDVLKKNFGKGDEWVVVFTNTNIKDSAKQTLYIFYSLDGHYLAANYTGE